jgi:hypothetical protein
MPERTRSDRVAHLETFPDARAICSTNDQSPSLLHRPLYLTCNSDKAAMPSSQIICLLLFEKRNRFIKYLFLSDKPLFLSDE